MWSKYRTVLFWKKPATIHERRISLFTVSGYRTWGWDGNADRRLYPRGAKGWEPPDCIRIIPYTVRDAAVSYKALWLPGKTNQAGAACTGPFQILCS